MPNQSPFNNYAGNLQYTGIEGIVIEDFRVSSTPKGTTTHFRISCSILSTLITLYNQYVYAGATVDFVGLDGGKERYLDVSFPGLTTAASEMISEVYFDAWELITNDATDTVFNDPYLITTLGSQLNYNAKAVLSRLARDGGTVSSAVSSCNSDGNAGTLTLPTPVNGGTSGSPSQFQAPPGAASGSPNNAVSQLALEIQKGQTEFLKPTYALRHTSYCSPGALYNTAIDGVMNIFSTAQLLSEVGSGWIYPLPPRLTSKIASIPVQFAPADEAPWYYWGWLKKITREPVLPNFMIEVNTEYELGLFSTLRYPVF